MAFCDSEERQNEIVIVDKNKTSEQHWAIVRRSFVIFSESCYLSLILYLYRLEFYLIDSVCFMGDIMELGVL